MQRYKKTENPQNAFSVLLYINVMPESQGAYGIGNQSILRISLARDMHSAGSGACT